VGLVRTLLLRVGSRAALGKLFLDGINRETLDEQVL